jgi:uncharacterized membrane protein YidH (DUF202 family)
VPAEVEVLSIRIAEVQLLLAEKRTSLAVLRAGMGIFLLPLSLFTALIATSKLYSGPDAAPIVVPLLVGVSGISIGMMALGGWLVWRAIRRIRRIDHKIEEIKQKNEELKHLYYDGALAPDEATPTRIRSGPSAPISGAED